MYATVKITESRKNAVLSALAGKWNRVPGVRPALLLVLFVGTALATAERRPFVIQVVDVETGRGVPLVELRAPYERAWYTDSAGIAAISESWLSGRDAFLEVRSHGYTFEEQVFETPAKIVRILPGKRLQLRIRRNNIAERLYRITGAGIYADSVAAGLPVPLKNPLLNGKVTGQDTCIAIPYNDRIYWFWGDTFGLTDANFSVSGATSALPGKGGLDPDVGIDLEYFVDKSGFSKSMLPVDRPGLVWVEGLMRVRDPSGRERLVATYTRQRKVGTADERGVAVFDDGAGIFGVLAQLPSTRAHRSSHPVRVVDRGRSYWYLYPTYRVPDDWNAIQDSHAYEAYTCNKAAEELQCGWKPGADFLDSPDEQKLIEKGQLPAAAALFALIDIDTGRPANFDLGSIAWNEYRKKWIMIAGAWGDVYYSEADAPQGPWRCAKLIVHHEKYNFYNVVHHAFFDKDKGRIIYFEGTYTTSLVNGATPTPLYDYNQIMYKLSLDDPRLRLPASCPVLKR
jgi:hypothetical protein